MMNKCPNCGAARDVGMVTSGTLPGPIERQLAAANERAGRMEAIVQAAINLYDNRLGWSDGRNPYAPASFWEALGTAIHPTGAKEG